MPLTVVEEQIFQAIVDNPSAYYDDIADATDMDVDTVRNVCKYLKEQQEALEVETVPSSYLRRLDIRICILRIQAETLNTIKRMLKEHPSLWDELINIFDVSRINRLNREKPHEHIKAEETKGKSEKPKKEASKKTTRKTRRKGTPAYEQIINYYRVVTHNEWKSIVELEEALSDLSRGVISNVFYTTKKSLFDTQPIDGVRKWRLKTGKPIPTEPPPASE